MELAAFEHEQTVDLQEQAHRIVAGLATATDQSPVTLSAGLRGAAGCKRTPCRMDPIQPASVLLYAGRWCLARLPAARALLCQVLQMLDFASSVMSSAIEQALTVLIDRLETRGGIETLLIGSRLDQAAIAVRRILDLLNGLHAQR